MSGFGANFEDTRIRQGTMAGYTGHIQERMEYEPTSIGQPPRAQIPGYGGFVPSVSSEN